MGTSSDWLVDIEVILGCSRHPEVKACSISRVPDDLRKATKKEAYSPKVVSIGPFHHGTRSDLQLMEQTKWRYTIALFRRAVTVQQDATHKLRICGEAIREMDPIVRASYGGEIKLTTEELARITIVDGCFFLELLLKLYDHVTKYKLLQPGKVEDMMKFLTDLTMLENQIPFLVLKKLHGQLSAGNPSNPFPSLEKITSSLFDYHVNANSPKACHFLHLMHLSSIHNENEKDTDTNTIDATQELNHCARELQASGITIQAGNDPATGTIALSKFVDKFDLNIKFDKHNRKLTIPPLHIKEGTEVKWRNLIAWEQSGIDDIGYKFTSYAYFFSGLICCVPDIELLRAEGVIIVDDPKIKDKNLSEMFRSIVKGAEKLDSRYSKLCKNLNARTESGPILHPRMWGHYFWRVLAWLIPWLREHFVKWNIDFKKDYLRNPWVFIGVLAGAVLLLLTIAQTTFAVLDYFKR